MALWAIRSLEEQVANLAAQPCNPSRTSACSQPRRRLWEVVVRLEGYVTVKDEQAIGWFEECQLQEALECLSGLQRVLEQLKALDSQGLSSVTARSDYTALATELKKQRATAERLLVMRSERTTPKNSPKNAPPGYSMDELAELPKLPESRKDANVFDGVVKIRDLNDLEDLNLQHCEHAADGICKNGCTVSSCMVKELYEELQ